MKIHLYCNTGFVGAKHEETIEVDDDATDAELDEMTTDWLSNVIDYGWHKDEDK